jgi:hypothetical protein
MLGCATEAQNRRSCGGKDAENSPQSRRFLPPYHRCIDYTGFPHGGQRPTLAGPEPWLVDDDS